MPRAGKRPSEVFTNVLGLAQKEILLKAAQAGELQHRGIKGDERAAALTHFLKRHLPGVFDVSKGEIIDFSDQRTGQLDVIIHNRAESNPVIIQSENILLPCEAAFLVCEVKSILNQDEMTTAVKAAQAVRRLRPFKEKFVGSPGRTKVLGADSHRCQYVIFAYDSNLSRTDWAQKEFERYKKSVAECKASLDIIDRIFVVGRGMLLPNASEAKVYEEEGDDDLIFLELYLSVVNLMARELKRRPPVDWEVYAGRSRLESKQLH